MNLIALLLLQTGVFYPGSDHRVMPPGGCNTSTYVRGDGQCMVPPGTGAPTDALYWLGAPHSGLSAEKDLSALATGLVLNTSGTPSAYSGASCTNQFLRSLDGSGSGTCSAVSGTDFTTQSANVFLAGPTSSAATPTFRLIVDSDVPDTITLSSLTQVTTRQISDTTGTLTVSRGGTGSAPGTDDQVLVADSTSAATWRAMANCIDSGGNHLNYTASTNTFSCGTSSSGGTTPTGTGFRHVTSGVEDSASKLVNLTASTDVTANQGTTAQVLHGNAAGQASWGSVALDTDVSGTLPVGSGGSGSAPASGDQVLVSDSTSAATWKTINDCQGSGKALTYTASSNTFGCNTIAGGSGNSVEVSVDLGTSGGTIYSTTVTGQSWVTSSSMITCTPLAVTTDGQTVETYYAAGLEVSIANRVVGTGFDLSIMSPFGATGIFRMSCLGV